MWKKLGLTRLVFQDISVRSSKVGLNKSSSIVAMVTKYLSFLDENKFCNRVIHKFCYDVGLIFCSFLSKFTYSKKLKKLVPSTLKRFTFACHKRNICNMKRAHNFPSTFLFWPFIFSISSSVLFLLEEKSF